MPPTSLLPAHLTTAHNHFPLTTPQPKLTTPQGITDPESSHVSRVLRAYYTEKNRPFPAWLGVDPREAAKAQRREQPPYVSTRPIGSLRGNSSTSNNTSDQRSSSGLSDLWSDGPPNPPQDDREKSSLRRGPLGGGMRGQTGQPSQYQDQGLNVRPLPSQRVGSYQTQQGQSPYLQSATPVPPGSSGSGVGSARDRLRDRLNRGGGSGRSTPENNESGGRYGGRDDGRGGGGGGGSYATQGLSGWQGRRG